MAGNSKAKAGLCFFIVFGLIGLLVFFVIKTVTSRITAAVGGIDGDTMKVLGQIKEMKDSGKFKPYEQETYAFNADPDKLDPFALLKEIRPKVGENCHLYSIEADFVSSDGTMNLNSDYDPEPVVKYKFYRKVPNPGQKEPPIGAGRSVGDVWKEKTEVSVYRPGEQKHIVIPSGYRNTSIYYRNKGLDFERSNPYMGSLDEDRGDPKVTTASLWKTALAKGAPKDAVATIVYNMNGYHFSITGAKIDLYFDFDGNLKH